MPIYTEIPTKEKWISDSTVQSSHTRSYSPVLKRIDTLVENLHLIPQTLSDSEITEYKVLLLTDLFMSIDHWLKIAQVGTARKDSTKIQKKRLKEVQNLYRIVVQTLCSLVGKKANTLPLYLESAYGKEMEDHGYRLDISEKMARYISRNEAEKYKLHFKGNTIYQIPWWSQYQPNTIMSKAKSSRCIPDGKEMTKGHAGYVLSIGRDFYMGPHMTPKDREKGTGFYHSSYFHGDTILCAGEILIENGVIKKINPRSGHYRPTPQHLVNALLALEMKGVDISQIDVGDFNLNYSKGNVFLENYKKSPKTHQIEAFNTNRIKQAAKKHSLFLHSLVSDIKNELYLLGKQIDDYKAHNSNSKKCKGNSGCTRCTASKKKIEIGMQKVLKQSEKCFKEYTAHAKSKRGACSCGLCSANFGVIRWLPNIIKQFSNEAKRNLIKHQSKLEREFHDKSDCSVCRQIKFAQNFCAKFSPELRKMKRTHNESCRCEFCQIATKALA